MVELVQELRRRGLRVGTVKHSSHSHELDRPGKDSFRHREAGGDPAAIITPGLTAVFLRPSAVDPYRQILALYDRCDLVLVEGGIDGPGTKIEVWRAGMGTAPMCSERGDIVAVISDDRPEVDVPVLPRQPSAALVEKLLERRLVPDEPLPSA